MTAAKILCPRCGAVMNRHAVKEDDPRGVLLEIHACPKCGAVESREIAPAEDTLR